MFKKSTAVMLLFSLTAATAHAGGLLTNTNQNISFNRNFAREGTIGVDGVYYREVDATTSDTTFSVLADDQVTCKDTVTKVTMDALTEDTYPTLTFTAYAVQQSGSASAAEAWAKVTTTP